MPYRVVATDRVSKKGLAPLREDDRFDVVLIKDSSDPEFVAGLKTAAGLIVRSATRVDASLLNGAPGLKVVGRAGVGVDNIDVAAASERGVAVMNAPGGNTISAAELTMALIAGGGAQSDRGRSVDSPGPMGALEPAGRRAEGEDPGCHRGRSHRMGGGAALPGFRDGRDRVRPVSGRRQSRRAAPASGVAGQPDREFADVITLHVPLNAETRGLDRREARWAG